MFSQYDGSDYAGYTSAAVYYSDCELYFGGDGVGVTNVVASNSNGCGMFAGGSGIGYHVMNESDLSNCIMFGGDEGVGYLQEYFINPQACLPYRSSEFAGVGYNTRRLSEFVEICVIIPLGQGMSPLIGNVVNLEGQLNWDTNHAFGVSHFDVNRSLDGFEWKKIGKVAANQEYKEEINYQFIDESMSTDKNYYFITMHYLDGSSTNSNIVLLEMDGAVNQKDIFTLYPNPSSIGTSLKIKSWNHQEWNVNIKIIDNSGRCIQNFDANFKQGGDHFLMNTTNLSTGTYSVIIQSNEDNTSIRLPFVLMH